MGAAIGLVGGAVLGVLVWTLWYAGQGFLPPEELIERVISDTVLTSTLLLLVNSVLALSLRVLLQANTPASWRFYGVLIGLFLGVPLATLTGFVGIYVLHVMLGGKGGLWILGAIFEAVACGLIEIVLGAITGAYIGTQLQK